MATKYYTVTIYIKSFSGKAPNVEPTYWADGCFDIVTAAQPEDHAVWKVTGSSKRAYQGMKQRRRVGRKS